MSVILLRGAGLCLALASVAAPGAAADLESAAALAGITAGMARECRLDEQPVLGAYHDLVERAGRSQAERRRLDKLMDEFIAEGARLQQQSGEAQCGAVRARVERTASTLKRAR